MGGTSQVVICGVGGDYTEPYFVMGSYGTYMEVKTATDLYYDITEVKGCDAIIIYNPNNPQGGPTHSILSVTNLKLTHAQNPETGGTVQPTVSRKTAELALNSLMPAPVNPFADVHEGDYYYDPILWAVRKGITNGVDASHFNPAAACNRAQVVTFLWRAAGCPEPNASKHPFVDVEADSFYYKAVLWAVEKGITNGVDATHFDPNGKCNRAQIVTFLWRAKGCPEPEITSHPFADVEDGSFYHKATLWAVENGITNGMTATSFAPTLTCTRGQVVTFLYRAYTK